MTVVALSEPRVCALPLILLFLACLVPHVHAQDLPGSIRGYKVHRQPIKIADRSDPAPGGGARVQISAKEPKLIEVSLTGITIEIKPEIGAFDQSGKVDFITFHDFTVNGIPVEVAEFTTSFEFRKSEPLQLPHGIRIFTPLHRVVQTAWKETRESRSKWTVTGRIFVFGKFRKFGMTFKRVVPVDISMNLDNPLL